jgi:hypothetical protein
MAAKLNRHISKWRPILPALFQNGDQVQLPFFKMAARKPGFLFLKYVSLAEVFFFSISSMVVAVIMAISAI